MKTAQSTPKSTASNQDELQQLREQLRQCEEHYKSLYEKERENTYQLQSMIANLPGFIYRCKNDEHWTMIYVSNGCKAITGYTPDDLVDNKTISFNEVIKEPYREYLYKKWQQTIDDKLPFYEEYEINTASGETRWVLEQAVAMYSENDNKVQYLIGYIDDITQKKALDKALSKSESKYRYLFENNPAPMYIYDEETLQFLEVNGAAIAQYDYTREEFLQRTIKDMRPQEDIALLLNDIRSTPQKFNRAGTWRHQKKNGELIYVDIVSHRLEYEGKKARLIISTDITQRVELQQELVKAKEKAEESDRLKSSFLANMSHEIRTPMNSILGFSELLKDAQFDDQQKEEFIRIITINGNNLLSIINDIIDISKIEAGEMKIHKASHEVNYLLETLKIQYEFHEMKPTVSFKWNCHSTPGHISVIADKDRLYQVFNNLISNALKFTSEGIIEVGYQAPTNGELVFYVRDTGIGIAKEDQSIIFKRFRQVETEQTVHLGGNGLGLAITKHLVELMNGHIWVESTYGSGSTFFFSLPLAHGMASQ